MKAIRIHEFGGPEVMQLEEIDRPAPAPEEILIKMFASGVNPADYIVRQGGNDLLRPMLRLPLGLGIDGAGIIENIGADVTGFSIGDRVYGIPNFLQGTYAEYIAAKANQFALMPRNLSFNEAGAIPSCALMAWNGMELGEVASGKCILVNGAAGGIGNLAVQFAKARGAYVIATSSPNNFDFLKQLGADQVLDYSDPGLATTLRDIDTVFDASPVRDENARLSMAAALKDGGIFVSVQIAYPFSPELLAVLAAKNAAGKMIRREMDVRQSLTDIAGLIEAGKVTVVVTKVYPLANAGEAHADVETKHVRGKVVLEIRKEN